MESKQGHIFDLFKSSFLLYKKMFLSLLPVSFFFSIIKFGEYYSRDNGLIKLLLIMVELALIIVFTLKILKIMYPERYLYTEYTDLVLSKFPKLLGVTLLIALILAITSLPAYITLIVVNPIKKKLILSGILLIIPFIACSFFHFASYISILRDIDENHYFNDSSLTESLNLVKSNFSTIIIVILIKSSVYIPFIIVFIKGIMAMNTALLDSMISYKSFILLVLLAPISFIVDLKLFYQLTDIDSRFDKNEISNNEL